MVINKKGILIFDSGFSSNKLHRFRVLGINIKLTLSIDNFLIVEGVSNLSSKYLKHLIKIWEVNEDIIFKVFSIYVKNTFNDLLNFIKWEINPYF